MEIEKETKAEGPIDIIEQGVEEMGEQEQTEPSNPKEKKQEQPKKYKPFQPKMSEGYAMESPEELTFITPLACIYCGDPHLSVLGVAPIGELIILCDNCRRMFVLFDKTGVKIKLKKTKCRDSFIR